MYRAFNRPALREACWPTANRHKFPVDMEKVGDGIHIYIIEQDALTSKNFDVVTNIRPFVTEPYSGGRIWIVQTGAGQFLVTAQFSIVKTCMEMAASGHHVLIRWMQGMNTQDAIRAGKNEMEQWQARLAEKRKPQERKPLPSLDDLDINI